MIFAKYVSGVPCFYAHFTGVRLTSQQNTIYTYMLYKQGISLCFRQLIRILCVMKELMFTLLIAGYFPIG